MALALHGPRQQERKSVYGPGTSAGQRPAGAKEYERRSGLVPPQGLRPRGRRRTAETAECVDRPDPRTPATLRGRNSGMCAKYGPYGAYITPAEVTSSTNAPTRRGTARCRVRTKRRTPRPRGGRWVSGLLSRPGPPDWSAANWIRSSSWPADPGRQSTLDPSLKSCQTGSHPVHGNVHSFRHVTRVHLTRQHLTQTQIASRRYRDSDPCSKQRHDR